MQHAGLGLGSGGAALNVSAKKPMPPDPVCSSLAIWAAPLLERLHLGLDPSGGAAITGRIGRPYLRGEGEVALVVRRHAP